MYVLIKRNRRKENINEKWKIAFAVSAKLTRDKNKAKIYSKSTLCLTELQLRPEASGLAVHSWCQCCDVCVRPTEARPLNGDGAVLTEVQMKAGGSRGHRQTVMKQQCDLQLAGPITAEQRSPHETLTSLKTFPLLPFQTEEFISASFNRIQELSLVEPSRWDVDFCATPLSLQIMNIHSDEKSIMFSS